MSSSSPDGAPHDAFKVARAFDVKDYEGLMAGAAEFSRGGMGSSGGNAASVTTGSLPQSILHTSFA